MQSPMGGPMFSLWQADVQFFNFQSAMKFFGQAEVQLWEKPFKIVFLVSFGQTNLKGLLAGWYKAMILLTWLQV